MFCFNDFFLSFSVSFYFQLKCMWFVICELWIVPRQFSMISWINTNRRIACKYKCKFICKSNFMQFDHFAPCCMHFFKLISPFFSDPFSFYSFSSNFFTVRLFSCRKKTKQSVRICLKKYQKKLRWKRLRSCWCRLCSAALFATGKITLP